VRTIKFRAWDKKDNTWYRFTDPYIHAEEPYEILRFDAPENSNFIFEQYTGLKDKNGVEIYEGDVIDIHQTVNGVNTFRISYNEKKARFEPVYHCEWHRDCKYEYSVSSFYAPSTITGEVDYEVIGNIHENPELIKD